MSVEVRHQRAIGAKVDHIDEIIARGCDLHIEQMSGDGWFMGLTFPDGEYWQFYFGSKNRRAAVEFRHVETSLPRKKETT